MIVCLSSLPLRPRTLSILPHTPQPSPSDPPLAHLLFDARVLENIMRVDDLDDVHRTHGHVPDLKGVCPVVRSLHVVHAHFYTCVNRRAHNTVNGTTQYNPI